MCAESQRAQKGSQPCGRSSGTVQGEPLGSSAAELGYLVEPPLVVRRGSSVTSASTTYLHTVITSPFCHQCSTVLTPWPVSVFYSRALIVVFECSLAFVSSWKKKTLLTLLTNLCYKPDLSPTIYPRYLMFPRLSSSYLCSPGMEHARVPFCDSNLDLQSRSGKCSLSSPGNLQIGWENEILISLIKNIFSIHCRAFPLLP